jgi:hypothetical protein
MSQFFRLGGWGVYPTTIIGLVLVAFAIQYARDPRTARMQVVRYLSVVTMLVAALGFVSGVIKALTSLPIDSPCEAWVFAAIGIGEALSNIAIGLFMLVVAWGASSLGAHRATTPGVTLTDPHSR